MNLLGTFLKPMHPAGWPFVAGFAVASALGFWVWAPLGWLLLVLTVWCYYFFRDPVRLVPQGEGLVVSPADGTVAQVGPATPPPELELGAEARVRIGIFMSVFNCHVNRAPVAGRVVTVAYHPGKFLSAALDKAAEENERNAVTLELPDGRRLGVVQIAGLVARRILCFTAPGKSLMAGERFGLIRFGSRLDVWLPEGFAPLVAPGQTMIAGETVIAAAGAPPRAARAD
jgi:phosphatidylserine decarboxylase